MPCWRFIRRTIPLRTQVCFDLTNAAETKIFQKNPFDAFISVRPLNWMNPKLAISTRSSLLRRLQSIDDEEGWREFVALYKGLIRSLALKACLTEHEAEEVLQEVLISVARNIRGFTYNPNVCSFKRWLSNMVRWRITSQYRLRRKHLTLSNPFAQGDQSYPPAEVPVLQSDQFDKYETEEASTLVAKALERVKNRVRDKQFQIYFLYVFKEKPVNDVCHQLKVRPGQVYLAKLRVGKLVEREIRSLYGIEDT
jgi:RNA polymerase sigma factor (sigma-70 family)